MAIASYKPTKEKLPEPNIPKIEKQHTRGIVVDSKYTPAQSLISHVLGALWNVNYFGQITDKHNDVRTQDLGQSGVYQQYQLIKNLELKVTDALTQSQNTQNNAMEVTGSAVIQPFMIPNVGDMFTADVGDGREGVFSITNTEKQTILKDSVYLINYTLLYYSDLEPQRRQDLSDKTIVSYNYVREFVNFNQDPKLIDEDFNAYIQLEGIFKRLANEYTRRYFKSEFSTFIIPAQSAYSYDHFVTKAVTAVLSTLDTPEMVLVRKLNLDDHLYLKQPQIFEALLKRDINLLPMCNKVMGLASRSTSNLDAMFDTFRYLGIAYFVYPQNPDISENNPKDQKPYSCSSQITVSVIPTTNTMTDTITVAGQQVLFIKPITPDSYVFSSQFYEGHPQSFIEALVKDYLQKKDINPLSVFKLTEKISGWGPLEKFYYIPVILMLIRAVIRNY